MMTAPSNPVLQCFNSVTSRRLLHLEPHEHTWSHKTLTSNYSSVHNHHHLDSKSTFTLFEIEYIETGGAAVGDI